MAQVGGQQIGKSLARNEDESLVSAMEALRKQLGTGQVKEREADAEHSALARGMVKLVAEGMMCDDDAAPAAHVAHRGDLSAEQRSGRRSVMIEQLKSCDLEKLKFFWRDPDEYLYHRG